jgi:hypothetical protein
MRLSSLRRSDRASRGKRLFGLAVFVASLLLIVGHQCLLLGVAHAAPPAETTSDHGHSGHHRADLNDCEILALKVSLPTEASPIAFMVAPRVVIQGVPTLTAPDGLRTPPISRTPLFLLHTSLLI